MNNILIIRKSFGFKMMSKTILQCVLILISSSSVRFVSSQSSPKCLEQRGSCACMTDKGLIDLSALDSKDATKPRFEDIPVSGQSSYSFSYNPCSSFSTSGSFMSCKNVAVCQKFYTYFYEFGTQESAKFQTDQSTQKLSIHYNSGAMSSNIILECDAAETGKLIVNSMGMSDCTMTLTSKHACPGHGGNGGKISFGSILCIVFFVVVTCYVLFGILIMRFYFGARGTEQIPNLNFWKELPSYTKAGFQFATSPCHRHKGGYDNV